MFGGIYFGQGYFAGYPLVESGPCGNNAFGAVYFGQYPTCGSFVPPPPPPSVVGRLGVDFHAIEFRRRLRVADDNLLDVVQVLTQWLNRN